MNTKHISLAAIAIVAVLTGCTKNPFEAPSDSKGLADLELASVNSVQTKAAIDGTTFPADGEIGLFLFENETATQAYGDGYENIKYTYNSTKGKWTASPSIKVGSTPGYLYGYYPYSSTAMDIKAIPIKSSLNGDDVMYATSQTVTDKTASQTAITMNHALVRISIQVVNNGYTGDAKLTKIKFSGAGIAPAGTLNALDGSISAEKNDVTLDVTGDAQTITASGTTYECLLVPSEVFSDRQTVSLTLTIDGEPKTATLSGNDNGVIFAQGTQSNITITLSNSGISVKTVSVENWNVVEVGGHKVTISVADGVDPNDILTKAFVDGDDVIIKASSEIGQHLKCTMPDGEFCTSQSKTNNLFYTFKISDITSNTTATIGYAKSVSIGVTPSKDAGSVEISGGELYEGETVTLKANPEYEYGFDAWLDKDGKALTCEEEIYPNIRLSSDEMSVRFIENLILDGVFTVADDGNGNVKKVRFTRGNLYYDGFSKVEQHQYDFNPAQWTGYTDHISHFMWCNNINDATSKQYNTSWNGRNPFFTENDFTVSGFSENQCHTLTTEEWQYLFSFHDYDNEIRRGKYKLGVTVCGNTNCVVLLPDNWTWGSNVDKKEYSYVEWRHMEAAGAVCLPAAGSRDGSEGDPYIVLAGIDGYYWSASEGGSTSASDLYFSGIFRPSESYYRYKAQSVRLVTDVT